MGPTYEIDEESMELIYKDAGTGWMEVRMPITQGQLAMANALAEKHAHEFSCLLSGFIPGGPR